MDNEGAPIPLGVWKNPVSGEKQKSSWIVAHDGAGIYSAC